MCGLLPYRCCSQSPAPCLGHLKRIVPVPFKALALAHRRRRRRQERRFSPLGPSAIPNDERWLGNLKWFLSERLSLSLFIAARLPVLDWRQTDAQTARVVTHSRFQITTTTTAIISKRASAELGNRLDTETDASTMGRQSFASLALPVRPWGSELCARWRNPRSRRRLARDRDPPRGACCIDFKCCARKLVTYLKTSSRDKSSHMSLFLKRQHWIPVKLFVRSG